MGTPGSRDSFSWHRVRPQVIGGPVSRGADHDHQVDVGGVGEEAADPVAAVGAVVSREQMMSRTRR